MTTPDLTPRTESRLIEGHVVTKGCRYVAETGRWTPEVSVRPAWQPHDEVEIAIPTVEQQDTPEDALVVAQRVVDEWIAAHRPAQ